MGCFRPRAEEGKTSARRDDITKHGAFTLVEPVRDQREQFPRAPLWLPGLPELLRGTEHMDQLAERLLEQKRDFTTRNTLRPYL